MRSNSTLRETSVLTLLAVCLLILGVCRAGASGIPGIPDGWLMHPQDTEYLLSVEPEKIYGRVELDKGKRWGFWGSVGQGRLYSLEDLPLLWVELGCAPTGRPLVPSVAVSFERVGGDFLAQEKRSAIFRWGTNPRVGLKIRSAGWTLADEKLEPNLAGEIEGRFHFRLGGLLVGVAGLYLNPWGKQGWPGDSGRQKMVDFKLLGSGSGVACRIDRKSDGTPIFTFEGMVRLSGGVGLGFRGEPESGSIGGSLVILMHGLRLETSHLVHPALGVTNRFLLGAGDPKASSR